MSDGRSPVTADATAERALFRGLVEDGAAVAAPGQLERLVARHLARGAEGYADLLGPLLVPAGEVAEFLGLKRVHPVRVLVVGPTGSPAEATAEAVDRLAGDPTVTVAGVQLPWADGWTGLAGLGVPISVEVPGGDRRKEAIADVAAHTAAGSAVQAALRVAPPGQGTATEAATELAGGIRRCVDLDLGFRLAGGPDRAVSTPEGTGFLNVLAATRYALAHAAEVPQLTDLLTSTDAQATVDVLTRMSEADSSVVRAFFTAFDTVEVVPAVQELARLRLVSDTV